MKIELLPDDFEPLPQHAQPNRAAAAGTTSVADRHRVVNKPAHLFCTLVLPTVCSLDTPRPMRQNNEVVALTKDHMHNQNAFYAEVGSKIRKARESLGITQEALASLVSLSRTSVTNIEKGRQNFLLHTFVDIAVALKVPPADLLPENNSELHHIWDELLKDRPTKEREWVRSAITSPTKRR